MTVSPISTWRGSTVTSFPLAVVVVMGSGVRFIVIGRGVLKSGVHSTEKACFCQPLRWSGDRGVFLCACLLVYLVFDDFDFFIFDNFFCVR